MMSLRSVRTPVLAAVAAASVACGPDTGGRVEEATPLEPELVEPIGLYIFDDPHRIEPDELVLDTSPATFELRITNAGSTLHSAVLEGTGQRVELGPPLRPGEVGTLQAELAPGRYVLYCPLEDHRALGEIATILAE